MNFDTTFALQFLVMLAMVIGLFGLIIPIFPGLVVIWASALGYGLAAGWQGGVVLFVLITLLAIVGSVVDNIFIGAKTLEKGGSWWTIGIASVAGLIGSLVFPPLGGLIGSLGAAFLFEFYRHKDAKKALHLTQGMAVGCGWAFGVRFLIGMIMIALWIIWAF